MRKTSLAWLLSLLGSAGVAVGYYSLWVLLAFFAAGVVWWAQLSFLVGGPLAIAGASVAYKEPQQVAAAVVGFLGALAWLGLWVVLVGLWVVGQAG